ncbi:4'-phosphopantetheinyl transferase superfamily protein [Streptomyces xanthochromogenes]|uniref:4'-phosphopantetheinyl transferase family protein n=1 Tax=Streptomyces xanthochromogenes TaxID=67384 RepID=UPI00343F0491
MRPVTRSPVDVWCWVDGTDVPDSVLPLLSDSERARAQRLRFGRHSAAYIWSRVHAKRILGPLLGLPPEQVRIGVRPCPGCGSPDHGPPTILPYRGVDISLSHSEGYSALAVSTRGPVGLDIEKVRALDYEALAAVSLSARERAHVAAHDVPSAFLRCWTRKEAVLKAVGIGLHSDLAALDVRPHRTGPVGVTHVGPTGTTNWEVSDLALPDNLAAAVAHPR